MSAPGSMRAAVVSSEGELRAVRLDRPVAGPGEVLVEVEACGICGSDLHAWRRRSWSAGLVPGHEIAGRVAAIGPVPPGGTERLAAGQPVVIEPLRSCGACASCRAGRDSICPDLGIAGVHHAGGLAEAIVVPAHRVHPVDAGIEPAVATLAEPLAVAFHGLSRAGFRRGDRVLVIGAGVIGLLCAFVARIEGASRVVVRARHPHQAALARDVIGVEPVEARGSIEAAGLASRFDVVIESVGGASETLLEAGLAAAPGGRIAVLGLFDHSPRIDPTLALAKELSIHWSNCYGRPTDRESDFGRATAALAAHHDELRHLVTHRHDLSDAPAAFKRADSKREGVGRVVVVA